MKPSDWLLKKEKKRQNKQFGKATRGHKNRLHITGTIIMKDRERQRVKLTFTEQKGLLIRVEAINPDRTGDRREFTGELIVSPKKIQTIVIQTLILIRLSPIGPVGDYYTDAGIFTQKMRGILI